MELLYFVFVFTLTWCLPLVIMLACHTAIIVHIYRRPKAMLGQQAGSGAVAKAKVRTVKLTSILVLGFILCWTPYNVMSLWWWIDKESAEVADFRLQKLLWVFACANNCLNPLFYGIVGKRSIPSPLMLTQAKFNRKQASSKKGSSEVLEVDTPRTGEFEADMKNFFIHIDQMNPVK